MSKIDAIIQQYGNRSTGYDEADVFIKVKMKMIRSLFEEIKGSEDRIYMEEIISKFAEILDCQQEIIDGLWIAAAAEDGYAPPRSNWVLTPNAQNKGTLTRDDIPWDPDCDRDEEEPCGRHPSYLPPEDGFQSDEQVKKAFINYLSFHVNRKTKAGKDKPFSIHTIYDYSSRIKVLMEIVCEEWKSGNRESRIQLSEHMLKPGCPFLNAYNNINSLKQYVEYKAQELRDVAMGLREPAPDSKKNPLNNPRNLNNTSAALARFEEFQKRILEQSCDAL